LGLITATGTRAPGGELFDLRNPKELEVPNLHLKF